jgi:DNA-binding MarR family transcriptional regulator
MKAALKTAAPTAATSLELGVLHDILGFHVRRVHKRMTRNFSEGVPDAGVARPGAFTALALISANPGVSQTALAREMGFDKATIVALIDSLEEQGWATRARATSDRRRHALMLTRAGEAALKRLTLTIGALEAPLRKGLSAADLRRLVELLDRAYLALISDQQ